MTRARAFGSDHPVLGWIRGLPEVDSDDGYGIVDCDIIWHYFGRKKGSRVRETEDMIFIEITTRGSIGRKSKVDTIRVFNALSAQMKKRVKDPNCDARMTHSYHSLEVADIFKGDVKTPRRVRWWGHHRLTVSGEGIEDSDWIRWDNTIISKRQLIEILRFEINPFDVSRKIDRRLHHEDKAKKQMKLALIESDAA